MTWGQANVPAPRNNCPWLTNITAWERPTLTSSARWTCSASSKTTIHIAITTSTSVDVRRGTPTCTTQGPELYGAKVRGKNESSWWSKHEAFFSESEEAPLDTSPGAYVDPTLFGLMGGLALMFIVMCVVLRLFAKWVCNQGDTVSSRTKMTYPFCLWISGDSLGPTPAATSSTPPTQGWWTHPSCLRRVSCPTHDESRPVRARWTEARPLRPRERLPRSVSEFYQIDTWALSAHPAIPSTKKATTMTSILKMMRSFVKSKVGETTRHYFVIISQCCCCCTKAEHTYLFQFFDGL